MTVAGNLLLASIPVIISLYARRWELEDEASVFRRNPHNFNLPVKKTYDFIIVGAGGAGCILANRLSKNFSVLVLEAGGEPPPLIEIPQLQAQIAELPVINYLFRTKPQKNAGLETGGVLTIPAGKMLGGSGSHNHLIYERGSPHDYDRWAKVTKDESWEYKNVLKYFKKIESYHGKYQNDQHGHSGPMDLNESSFPLSQDLWLQAGKELGYKILDPNGPQRIGFSVLQSLRRNGRRVSTYTAYLKPILRKRRKNLKVFKYSTVSKVIFRDKTAIGVEFKRHGVSRAAFASKEIILSAGTFMSPIILFKSGIGPKDQVEAAKAERHIADLPVGKNLMDHHKVVVGPILVDQSDLTWTVARNLSYGDVINFTKHGQGPLAAPVILAEAYIKSSRKSSPGAPEMDNWPDLRVAYNPFNTKKVNVVGGYCNLGRPLSRGVLTINATSSEDDTLPILDYKYFSVPSDLETSIEGIKFLLKIFEETKSFKKVGARLSDEPYGGCKDHKFRSMDYWKCYVRHKTSTAFHSSGTCRMGHHNNSFSDPRAVVDSKLRVIGVKRLRVVDASIMPYLTNTNIFAPTLLIGEKGSHDILKAHKHSRQ